MGYVPSFHNESYEITAFCPCCVIIYQKYLKLTYVKWKCFPVTHWFRWTKITCHWTELCVTVPGLQGGKRPRWQAGREALHSLAWSRPAGSLWSGHVASQIGEASRSPWGQWSWQRPPPPSWEEHQALQHNTAHNLHLKSSALEMLLSKVLTLMS